MPDHVLAELEQDFGRLADEIPDTPTKQAISVLHGMGRTDGRVRSPTVVVGGDVLVQPTIEELEWALRQSRAGRSA